MAYVYVVITGVVSDASRGDLASILQEVNHLRIQLERCISSNEQLRYTLRRSGAVITSADDGSDTSARQRDGKLM